MLVINNDGKKRVPNTKRRKRKTIYFFFSFVVGFLEAKTTYTVEVKAEITVPEFSECA